MKALDVRNGIFASAFAAIATLIGAAAYSPDALAATGRIQMDVAGQKRSALLIEFQRLKRQPRTLLIVLRGGGARQRLGRTDARGIGVAPLVRNAGVAIVYPDAVGESWNVGQGGAVDVGYIRALVAKLVADRVADPRRIFIAGVASGGVLALRTACEGADYLTGVMTLISNMPVAMQAGCKPARPLAFMALNGTADPLAPYQGGAADLGAYKGEVLSTEDTLKPFIAAAQCSGERTKVDLPDRDPNDGSRVSIDKFSGCKVNVELIRVTGGGHTLPGRPAAQDRGVPVGALNNDISTPRVLWDFVRRSSK